MSEVAAIKKETAARLPLRVYVQGKVTRVRRHEKFVYTTVICPAKDEYSRPSVVEIRSKARFAEVEETCKADCELGGYEGKSYVITDRESGERKTLIPVNHYLDLIEQ